MSAKERQLDQLRKTVAGCRLCALSTTRNHPVFGEGDPDSPVVLIGEAPGQQEDLQGRPFVGKSGKLLEEMIQEVFALPREKLYITNIVKCRPTVAMNMERDRPPERDELEACKPLLIEELNILRPEVIVTLGASSTKGLLQTREGITKIRGQWHEFNSIALLPTFHPSYVLRNGGKKSQAYKIMCEDLAKARDRSRQHNLHDH